MSERISRALLVVALLVIVQSAAACRETVVVPTTPAPVTPTTPTPAKLNTIEYRVSGTPLSVRIRFSNPVDGLTQTVSGLPYVVDTATSDTTIFLSLDVTPLSFPFASSSQFLSAQIFVNQQLFREASSTDTTGATLSVNGTWRAF